MMEQAVIETEYDYGMPVHPLCDLFPLMNGSDLGCLEGDLLENGLINPIVVHEGQLVDGRNRLLACKSAHVKPRFVEWRDVRSGSESLARWIWSVNAERRHLTLDQYLAVQVAFGAWEEQQAAKLKMVEGGKAAGKGRPQQGVTKSSHPNPPPERAPAVRSKLAKQLNVSEHKVQQALNVQKADPGLLKEVTKGTVKLSDAAKRVKKAAPAKVPQQPLLFDVEASIKPIMRALDVALRGLTNEQRRALLSELTNTLRRM
jgi:hypothetical protein